MIDPAGSRASAALSRYLVGGGTIHTSLSSALPLGGAAIATAVNTPRRLAHLVPIPITRQPSVGLVDRA